MKTTPSNRWQAGIGLSLLAALIASCGGAATTSSEPPTVEAAHEIAQETSTPEPSPVPTETSAPSPTPEPEGFFNPVANSSVLNAGTQYFDPGEGFAEQFDDRVSSDARGGISSVASPHLQAPRLGLLRKPR